MPSNSVQSNFFKYLPVWGKYRFRWTMSALLIPFSSSILIACVNNGVHGKFQGPLHSLPIHLFLFTSFFIPAPVLLFLAHFFLTSFSCSSSRGAVGASSSCQQFLVLERMFYYTLIYERQCQNRFPGGFWHWQAERIRSIRRKSLSLRALKACKGLPVHQSWSLITGFAPLMEVGEKDKVNFPEIVWARMLRENIIERCHCWNFFSNILPMAFQ